MIAWLVMKTGFSAIVIKLLLLLVASGAIFWCIQYWGTKQWEKGQEAGRLYEAKAIEKAKIAVWELREKAIDIEVAQIIKEKESIDAAKAQLAQDRATIARSLKDVLAVTAARKEANNATIIAIPAAQLDSALRSVSGELAIK